MFHYVLASSGRRSGQFGGRFEHQVDVHRGNQDKLGETGVQRQVEGEDKQEGGFSSMEDHNYSRREGLKKTRDAENYQYQVLAGPMMKQKYEMSTYSFCRPSMGTGALGQFFWQGQNVIRRWPRRDDLTDVGEKDQLQFQVDDLGPAHIFSPRGSPVYVPAVGAHVEVGENVEIDVMAAIDEGDGLGDIDVGVIEDHGDLSIEDVISCLAGYSCENVESVETGENVENVDNDE